MHTKLVCFDLDGTLIAENSWQVLNTALGISEEADQHMFAQYERGVLAYEDWIAVIAKRYRTSSKATRVSIEEILSHYTLREGAREVIDALKARGFVVAIISGSVDILVERVARDLGVSEWRAMTKIVFDDTGAFNTLESHGDEAEAKLESLQALCKARYLRLHECVCVGDGANDVELFRASRHGVTFTGSSIAGEAWKVIDSLKELPSILGV